MPPFLAPKFVAWYSVSLTNTVEKPLAELSIKHEAIKLPHVFYSIFF
jgi:hypothetical protein